MGARTPGSHSSVSQHHAKEGMVPPPAPSRLGGTASSPHPDEPYLPIASLPLTVQFLCDPHGLHQHPYQALPEGLSWLLPQQELHL